MDRENRLHDRLVDIVAPLVMAPCGPPPADGVRLRGVVRAGVGRARIVVQAGGRAPAGVAVELRLTGDGGTELDVDAAVDWVRSLTCADLTAAVGERDSDGNVIVAADTLGFSASHRARVHPGVSQPADSDESEDHVPDNGDDLVFLSPEQYEALLEAREGQRHDLSREQVEAVLKAHEERLGTGRSGDRPPGS